jgi:outer membrane protein assembly factor BamE (lipoprotein component of BamABCDE complex)
MTWLQPLALGLLLVTACSPTVQTHGYRIDPGRLAQVRPGASSREDVYALLGSPSTIGSFDQATWYYITRTTERRSFYQEDTVAQDVIAIAFDENGRVSRIAENDIVSARAIDPVERETPTAGNELTVFEQFVGNIGRFNLPRDADTGQ